MSTVPHSTGPQEHTHDNEQQWAELCNWLLPLVESWVRKSRVISWYGQQREVSEEITQEALMRTFEQHERAINGEISPIISLRALSCTIARHHLIDRQRKDQRLVRQTQTNASMDHYIDATTSADPSQIALANLEFQVVLMNVVTIIIGFPNKQKTAVLIDLATDFCEESTFLEQALLQQGVRLRDYKHKRPEDWVQRRRHAASLSIAKKRLRNELSVS